MSFSQPFLDFLQLRPHAVAPALALQQEAALSRFAADEGEAEEIEGLRLSLSKPCRARLWPGRPPRGGRTR